jgi:endonuclease I
MKKINMKKNIKKFVLELPGPTSSYCSCNIACSIIDIDHVMPKSILIKKVNNEKITGILNDPNNLYRCCKNKNRQKGNLILCDSYPENEYGGLMARSMLYMNSKYKLKFRSDLVKKWESLSNLYPPYPFEKSRSLRIGSYTGNPNPFIDFYPNTNHFKD